MRKILVGCFLCLFALTPCLAMADETEAPQATPAQQEITPAQPEEPSIEEFMNLFGAELRCACNLDACELQCEEKERQLGSGWECEGTCGLCGCSCACVEL